MMYFDSRARITPLNTGQQFVDQLLFGFFHFTIALDQAGFRAVDNFDFAQAVSFQRGTGGNQSQIASASPARGATSTEPFSKQDLKEMPFWSR